MTAQIGKREAAKQAKRKRILEEATYLFSSRGYKETTIQKIAEASEISFGSVFTYFETKEKLLEAAILEPLEEVRNHLLVIDYETEDVLGELRRLISRNIQLFSTNRVYLQLIQQVLGRPESHEEYEEIARVLDNFFNEFVQKVIPLIEKGQQQGRLKTQDPEVIAMAYFGFLNGIRLTMGLDEDHILWEKFIEPAYQLFGPIE
ncbi:TetR/AcrR family transcriptional regulator [Pseudalkalibacillus sp. SCS-8]|uniref:TetR/AcrR family transcriptional regulator n=1 Tax=Pseudalkalibacillus nanhaiensis TaxID=3115291 RepID=UPI0032DA1AE7